MSSTASEIAVMTESIARKVAAAREEGIRVGMNALTVADLIAAQQKEIERLKAENHQMKTLMGWHEKANG